MFGHVSMLYIVFYVFNNIIYKKYEPTQRLIYSFVCYQFDIYFYVGINWRYGEKKKL